MFNGFPQYTPAFFQKKLSPHKYYIFKKKLQTDKVTMSIRHRIYEIVDQGKDGDKISLAYDIFMVITVVISLIPLGFKEHYEAFKITDFCTAGIFILDYILRWITADYKLKKRSITSFLKYPFTPGAIIDLLTILPVFALIADQFKLFRLPRMIKALRLLKILGMVRAFRYSKTIKIVLAVIKSSKEALIVVAGFSFFYVIVSALLVFNVEPDTFNTFFDAIYWATVSLTTVGYGDLYPVTTIGKAISMMSSFFGIAIIALPASIITAGYMKAVDEYVEEKKVKRKNR